MKFSFLFNNSYKSSFPEGLFAYNQYSSQSIVGFINLYLIAK